MRVTLAYAFAQGSYALCRGGLCSRFSRAAVGLRQCSDTAARLAGLAGLPMQRTGEARALHASLSLHLPGKRSLYPSPHTPHSSLYPFGQRSVRQSQSQVIGSAGADRACGKYVST